MGDEMGVRKFVHGKLMKLDKHYQRIEFIRMNEETGDIHVKWVNRENLSFESRFKYHRNV